MRRIVAFTVVLALALAASGLRIGVVRVQALGRGAGDAADPLPVGSERLLWPVPEGAADRALSSALARALAEGETWLERDLVPEFVAANHPGYRAWIEAAVAAERASPGAVVRALHCWRGWRARTALIAALPAAAAGNEETVVAIERVARACLRTRNSALFAGCIRALDDCGSEAGGAATRRLLDAVSRPAELAGLRSQAEFALADEPGPAPRVTAERDEDPVEALRARIRVLAARPDARHELLELSRGARGEIGALVLAEELVGLGDAALELSESLAASREPWTRSIALEWRHARGLGPLATERATFDELRRVVAARRITLFSRLAVTGQLAVRGFLGRIATEDDRAWLAAERRELGRVPGTSDLLACLTAALERVDARGRVEELRG
jgi:hypothetical protein